MDVVDLREFYASPLGQASRRLIARRIRSRWESASGATVLGLGYATPYLDQFRQEARAIVGFMPGEQGVVHWPADGGSATALVDEVELPVIDSSIDFVLVAHGLELTDHPMTCSRRSGGFWRRRVARCSSFRTDAACGRASIRHPSAMDGLFPRCSSPRC